MLSIAVPNAYDMILVWFCSAVLQRYGCFWPVKTCRYLARERREVIYRAGLKGKIKYILRQQQFWVWVLDPLSVLG